MVFTNVSQAKKLTNLSYLGNVNISAKLKKNLVVHNQRTFSLYLAPSKLSGYNVCTHSTPECRMGCLNTSGRAGMEINTKTTFIADARKKKTKLFFENKLFFMEWLVREIYQHKQLAEKNAEGFSVRLNCTSDIEWENVLLYNGKNIFDIFSDVNFYDYTKNAERVPNKPKNYHLTLSYTGRNWDMCSMVLKSGLNVAVVFNLKPSEELPQSFRGFKVVDGDISDYRIADEKGVIIGLKWKNIGNKTLNSVAKKSIFVVQPEEIK